MNAFEKHGKLQVKGTQLCDANGEAIQLRGPSTLGIIWYPEYINEAAVKTYHEWGANLLRLAMYTAEEDGYLTGGDQEYQKNLIDIGVKSAVKFGMYVIIDWHILSDGNPQTHKEEAKVFFEEMTKKYAGVGNVIYEICNEPNGEDVDWPTVKSYAEEIIPIIRKNAPDAVIIVGTPVWSQEVDKAADDPLTGDNIMYAVHYYAATHKQYLRDKVSFALDKGAAIFVSEYSTCDASGNGAIDHEEAELWKEFVDKNCLSYAQWNLANRNETSSMIKVECNKTSDWTEDDLTETGIWLKRRLEASKEV